MNRHAGRDEGSALLLRALSAAHDQREDDRQDAEGDEAAEGESVRAGVHIEHAAQIRSDESRGDQDSRDDHGNQRLVFLPLKNPPAMMARHMAIMEKVNVSDVSERDQPNSFSRGTTKIDHP